MTSTVHRTFHCYFVALQAILCILFWANAFFRFYLSTLTVDCIHSFPNIWPTSCKVHLNRVSAIGLFRLFIIHSFPSNRSFDLTKTLKRIKNRQCKSEALEQTIPLLINQRWSLQRCIVPGVNKSQPNVCILFSNIKIWNKNCPNTKDIKTTVDRMKWKKKQLETLEFTLNRRRKQHYKFEFQLNCIHHYCALESLLDSRVQ